MAELSSPLQRSAQLTDALLGIVADRGLDQVSVREVASAAGVSIGTVQHYFPTKDDMLAAAFEEVVRRVRTRIATVRLTDEVRHNLRAVLRELLPLDQRRAVEARIQVAFAARAATSPPLAAIQRTVLAELRDGLAAAFATAGAGRARATLLAGLVAAGTDGLALHAVSTPGWLSPSRMTAALDLLIDCLLAEAGA